MAEQYWLHSLSFPLCWRGNVGEAVNPSNMLNPLGYSRDKNHRHLYRECHPSKKSIFSWSQHRRCRRRLPEAYKYSRFGHSHQCSSGHQHNYGTQIQQSLLGARKVPVCSLALQILPRDDPWLGKRESDVFGARDGVRACVAHSGMSTRSKVPSCVHARSHAQGEEICTRKS
ncbi:hypothetical protein B0H34DRAFT_89826 [Crassisporium funariophilum]|nr:hypothetical protein B0H34DRAFT_89826 [Crassisporium funariophilum]